MKTNIRTASLGLQSGQLLQQQMLHTHVIVPSLLRGLQVSCCCLWFFIVVDILSLKNKEGGSFIRYNNSYNYNEGTGPEWYISSMLSSQDIPFWSGTLHNMTIVVVVVVVLVEREVIIIIIMTIMTLKDTIQELLLSTHKTANCLQDQHSPSNRATWVDCV